MKRRVFPAIVRAKRGEALTVLIRGAPPNLFCNPLAVRYVIASWITRSNMEADHSSRIDGHNDEGNAGTNNSVPEVVDPEVRAYVYSLVSAVSRSRRTVAVSILTMLSLAGLGPTKMADMCWVTMRWLVLRTSSAG